MKHFREIKTKGVKNIIKSGRSPALYKSKKRTKENPQGPPGRPKFRILILAKKL